MPSILIDFDDRRDVFDVPVRSVAWQKVVELDVGEAPKVDVFFNSGNQEIRIKSFQFSSKKTRRVAVTVAVDVNNTVTAQLVALANTATDSNDPKKDGTIVSLALSGTTTAFTRTSKRTLCPPTSLAGSTAFTRTSERPLCPITSVGGSTGEQFDEAAATAALAVPPSQASAVFIVPYEANWQYAVRKRMVDALESAGYSNVRCIEGYSPLLSAVLQVAKPNKQVGEYVGIGQEGVVYVVRKTDRGYDYVFRFVHGMKHFRKLFPTIKEIICYSIMFHGPRPNDDERRKMLQQYHPLPVKLATIAEDYLTPYMWNKHDGGNMDGYLVTMPVQCKFRINYNGKNTVVDARTEMLPWQKSIKIHIGHAMAVDIFMDQMEADYGEVHVKQFQFTSKKSRKVSISIAVDDARLPEVKLITL